MISQSTTALTSASMTLFRLLIILLVTTPLTAALSPRTSSANAVTINECSNKASSFLGRAALVPSYRRRRSRDSKLFCVRLAAFVTPTAWGAIAASSLRRRHFLNSHASIDPIRATSSRRGRSVRIFMIESSSTLDHQDQGRAHPGFDSAAFALDDNRSRTGSIMHSLQGGASVTDHESEAGNEATLDECVDQSGRNGDADGDHHEPGSNNDKCNSHSSSDKETSEREKKVLIHIYRHHDTLQSNSTASKNANNNRIDDLTLYYENAIFVGVGVSQGQFATWVHYQLVTPRLNASNDQNAYKTNNDNINIGNLTTTDGKGVSTLQVSISMISNRIHTQEVDWENEWESHISSIRKFWREERLLCEYTSILSPKRRARTPTETTVGSQQYNYDGQTKQNRRDEEERIVKSESFKEALSSYAERMVSIVEDEMSDFHHVVNEFDEQAAKREQNHHATPNGDALLTNSPRWNSSTGLLGWIEHEYGVENTHALMADSLLKRTEDEQLEKLRSFLIWFRSKFPYYHDKCNSCGASCKETSSMMNIASDINQTEVDQKTNEVVIDQADAENLLTEDREDINVDDVSFLGYVYPSITERLGNASRTELYRCRSCDSFTRFPRYNRALWITHTRRGRCGEYSMLLYRFLRAMGYEKLRWVVDWADHVWVEVWLGEQGGSVVDGASKNGRWVHCDPCEASVDEPLLYQGWGKNQTYIVAFYDPFKNKIGTAKTHGSLTDDKGLQNCDVPLVEDVTTRYTSDDVKIINDRRGISNEFMSDTIQQVSIRLSEMLSNHQR